MTNDLEKQFFDTFGIEPKKQCYYWDCPYSTGNIVNDTAMNERDCNSCKNPNKEIYPQITDTHYLKLICLINVSLIKIVKLRGENLEQLKSFILQGCITDYEFYSNSSLPEHREQAENLKHQVQALFGGNND